MVVLLAVTLLALGAPAAAEPGPTAGTRYIDPVFVTVDVTSDIQYGRAPGATGPEALMLDLYEPAGDSATGRPAVLWVHGGSFSGGDKAAPFDALWSTDLAKRGYVVASINYRLGAGPSNVTITNAQHDAQAAVRYLRANAAALGIDPARIAITGYSAGGVTAIEVAQSSTDAGASGNPGYSSRVCFAASQAGGTVPDVDARDTPLAFFNATDDTTVPIVLAQIVFDAYKAAGLPTWMYTYPGDHLAVAGQRTDVQSKLLPLMKQYLVDGSCAEPALPAGGSFHPVTARISDSRTGAPYGPNEARLLPVAPAPYVPADAAAVVVNVTAVGASEPTHLTVYPGNAATPGVSNLNLVAGETRAVSAMVGLQQGGISIRNRSGSVHVVVDLVGWFDGGRAISDGGRIMPLDPVRLADSRKGLGFTDGFNARETKGLPVAGVEPVFPSATALLANLTLVGPLEPTHLTAFPSFTTRPPTSSVNAPFGAVVPNLALVPLGFGGMDVYSSGATAVLVDALGQVLPADGDEAPEADSLTGRFRAVLPSRVFDTRTGVSTTLGPLGPGEARSIDPGGLGGVPPGGVMGVVLSLTATDATATTHLAVYPGGLPSAPRISNLNVDPGRAVANLVVVPLGSDGTISVRNESGNVEVIMDTVGYLASW